VASGWVGLVPAYTYVDNVAAAISGTEVLGIPTIGAAFDEAESSWMSETVQPTTLRRHC
jgi:hypothetical protein